MKKWIRLCAAALAVTALLAFAGCSARTSITADDFTKQAKNQGFTVKDTAAPSADVDKYVDAVKSETDTEIIYLSFKSETSAETTYNSLKQNASQGTNAKTSTLDSATYNKFTVTNGELNYTIARMDTTVVYGKATSSHQNQVDDFFKAIKY